MGVVGWDGRGLREGWKSRRQSNLYVHVPGMADSAGRVERFDLRNRVSQGM